MNDFIAQVRSVLAIAPARWEALTAELDVALLRRRPAPGEWSAVECLRHVTEAERGTFQLRLNTFRTGYLPPFDPASAGPRQDVAPADLAADFAAARRTSLELLAGLPSADLELTARHHALGQVTLREMLNEWAGHDLMHTVQAERALMQPFLVASGPWRSHFADHDVERK